MVAGYACGDQAGSVPHLASSTHERLNDKVQARVYLARRIYAGAEFAWQNADQGIQFVSDARSAAAMGL